MWRVRTFNVCEAVVHDGRGFMTMVGFDTPFFPINEFPRQVTPTLVTVLEYGEVGSRPAPSMISVRTWVSAPDGETVFLAEMTQQLGDELEAVNPLMPLRLNHFTQATFNATKPGLYVGHVLVQFTDGSADSQQDTDFLVVDQSSLNDLREARRRG